MEEQIRKNILNKIKEKKLNFNLDEINLFSLDHDLVRDLIHLLINNTNLIYDYTYELYDIIDLCVDNDIVADLYDDFIQIADDLYNAYLIKKIDIIEPDVLTELKKYYNNFIDKLNNNELNADDLANFEKRNCDILIEKMLNDKKYLAIYNLMNKITIKIKRKETYDRLINEFTFDLYPLDLSKIITFSFEKDGITSFLDFNYTYSEYLDKSNFASLKYLYFTVQDNEKQKNIENKIIEIINNPNNNLNFKFTPRVVLENDEKKRSDFSKLILSNFNQPLSENNISIYLNFDIELNEEEITRLYELLDNLEIDNTFNNKYLLENEKFMQHIIDLGMFFNIPDSYQEKYIDYISKSIDKAYLDNNKKYLSKISFSTFSEIYKKIIINLIQNNHFELLNYSRHTNDEIKKLISKKIIELPISELRKYNLFNEFVQTKNTELLNELIKLNQIDKISYLENSIDIKNLDIEFETYSKIIKESYSFAILIFDRFERHIIRDDRLRNLYFSLESEKLNNKILQGLPHVDPEGKLYDQELYNYVKKSFIKKYNLNELHLDYLAHKYGYRIIQYIDSANIINIINLDDYEFYLFTELFQNKEYQINDMETIYDSFKQEEFSKVFTDVINIFPSIMHSLELKDNSCLQYFNELKTVWCDSLIKKIINKFPDEEVIIKSNIDYIDYVSNVLLNSSSSTKNKYTNILHIISDFYIASKREEYRKTYKMYEESKIPFNRDTKDLDKFEIFKYLEIGFLQDTLDDTMPNDFFNKIISDMEKSGISKKDSKKIIFKVIRKSLIEHIKNNDYNLQELLQYKYKFLENDKEKSIDKVIEELEKEFSLESDIPNLNKNIGLVLSLAEKNKDIGIAKYGQRLCEYDIEKAKKQYYLSKPNLNIYEIFSNIRIELLKENVLNNSEIYKSLLSIMKKYKLDTLPPQVNNLASKDVFDLSCTSNDISVFISFFHSIYKTEKSSLEGQGKKTDNLTMSIVKIFKYLDRYSAVSSIYSQILGVEDEGLIRSDPTPNHSHGMTKEERLKAAVKKTFDNFNKKSIKVPGFYYDAKLDDGKTMTAIVGNFTKPTNLTHGERTGACMRIGGAGYSLFNSEEIFHIEFSDPNTGKYISRVTGFRNGNTVFLNELRCSCDKELYSDLEIVNACKQVAQQLIERTKDSSYPIENVVIHRDYAMNETKDDRVQLNIEDNKEGLSKFYSDVGSYVQVLATTSETGFTPVILGNKDVPDYKPVREKIRSGNDKTIIEQINRIYTIKLGLQGKNYYVNPIASEIVYGFVGEDWYVFINEQNEIVADMINRDERAIDEFEYAKEEIKKYMSDTLVEEEKYAI